MVLKTKLHIPHVLHFLFGQLLKYNIRNLSLNIKAKRFNAGERKKFGTNNGECWRGKGGKGRKIYKISIYINSGKGYPDEEKWGIQLYRNKYIYDSENIRTKDEALAWILGHEFWHYFCYTGQEHGNVETKANACGFRWLRAFKNSQ